MRPVNSALTSGCVNRYAAVAAETEEATEEALGLIDVVYEELPAVYDVLAAMQPGAIVINAARGGIVDEMALAEALKSGHIGGAGIDTWNEEPPPRDHPLLQFKNLIATYHTAGITHDSRNNMAEWNATQVAGILRGERPPRLINPEAWDGFCKRFERLFGFRPAA